MDFSDLGLQELFDTVLIRDTKLSEVEEAAERIVENRARYEAVPGGIPWMIVGILHCMESGFNFGRHLHNGDPLTARTVDDPKGRPVAEPASGKLPYTWEESAADALSQVWKPVEWTVGGSLNFLEHYNGLGYRKHGVYSPYVWSYTTAYSCGKFMYDDQFFPTVISKQMGGAAILKVLEAHGVHLL